MKNYNKCYSTTKKCTYMYKYIIKMIAEVEGTYIFFSHSYNQMLSWNTLLQQCKTIKFTFMVLLLSGIFQ